MSGIAEDNIKCLLLTTKNIKSESSLKEGQRLGIQTMIQKQECKQEEKAGNKIHFVGYPCKVDTRLPFKSVMLTSNTDPNSVTCKACISVCTKIATAWQCKI
jgi:hypothetical protein